MESPNLVWFPRAVCSFLCFFYDLVRFFINIHCSKVLAYIDLLEMNGIFSKEVLNVLNRKLTSCIEWTVPTAKLPYLHTLQIGKLGILSDKVSASAAMAEHWLLLLVPNR